MKKILFVIDSLHSGGAEKSLLSLLTLFDYKKYRVDLLLFSPKGLYFPLLPKEVNILEVFRQKRRFKDLYLRLRGSISLRNPYKVKRLHGAQISWSWMSKGMEQVEDEYDVAIAYSQGTPTYFVAEKVKAKKKFCWINTDYKIAPYNKTFDARYYEKFDQVVAVSEGNKAVFVEEMPLAKKKTTVIYDIVSPSLIHSMAIQEGGFDDDFTGMKILTIGRLVEAKGYDLAIEACAKLVRQGYPIKWYVIGEGPLKEKMQQMITKFKLEHFFVMLGTFQNPYVYLKQCDIYVQTSRFEGFGLAIAEARILHKPVVATNFTVVHNQIKDGENGLIVKMNADDLVVGIQKILDDTLLRQRICKNLSKENIGTEAEIHKVYALIES